MAQVSEDVSKKNSLHLGNIHNMVVILRVVSQPLECYGSFP